MFQKLKRLGYYWDCLTKYRPRPSITLAPYLRDPMAKLLAPMAPQRAEGVKKKRFGARYDGGYVMLDDFAGIVGVYSLGTGQNVQWDLAMAQKGLPVWQYDHTVDGPPFPHPNFFFHKVRIGAKDDPSTPTASLPTMIKGLGPLSGDLILKIDIEGDEWEVFSQIDPDQLKVFRQILVEFHDFSHVPDPAWRELVMTALAHLNCHHQAVHVHGNNFGGMIRIGGIRLPDGLEVTFVRKDAYRLVSTEEAFPGPLDHPNNPVYPDARLGRFRFD